MLEVKCNQDQGCLSCGDKEHSTVQIKINRAKNGENIITMYLCRECLNKLSREFFPYS